VKYPDVVIGLLKGEVVAAGRLGGDIELKGGGVIAVTFPVVMVVALADTLATPIADAPKSEVVSVQSVKSQVTDACARQGIMSAEKMNIDSRFVFTDGIIIFIRTRIFDDSHQRQKLKWPWSNGPHYFRLYPRNFIRI
jgi:hypothetical protein